MGKIDMFKVKEFYLGDHISKIMHNQLCITIPYIYIICIYIHTYAWEVGGSKNSLVLKA